MLSTTLETGLKAYSIGAKVRQLRLKKSMGLVELGKHTGMSAAISSFRIAFWKRITGASLS